MEFEFKINGKTVVSETEEVSVKKLLELAAEQNAIAKTGSWELRDEKGTMLDPESKLGANSTPPLTATLAGPAKVAN